MAAMDGGGVLPLFRLACVPPRFVEVSVVVRLRPCAGLYLVK
jgi:hypothetical protein